MATRIWCLAFLLSSALFGAWSAAPSETIPLESLVRPDALVSRGAIPEGLRLPPVDPRFLSLDGIRLGMSTREVASRLGPGEPWDEAPYWTQYQGETFVHYDGLGRADALRGRRVTSGVEILPSDRDLLHDRLGPPTRQRFVSCGIMDDDLYPALGLAAHWEGRDPERFSLVPPVPNRVGVTDTFPAW